MSVFLRGAAALGVVAVHSGFYAGYGALCAKCLHTRIATGAVFGAISGTILGTVSALFKKVIMENGCPAFVTIGAMTFFGSAAASWQVCKWVHYDVGSFSKALILEENIATGIAYWFLIRGGLHLIADKCRKPSQHSYVILEDPPSLV